MKEVKDRFSKQSGTYKKFRPRYPQALYEALLSLVPFKHACWDCGTGNGQAASELAASFKHVYATDISQNQIHHATQKKNVTYIHERAEQTGFPDNSFDLITVAQAIHWFDLEAFGKEVGRVAKNGGILGVWGYGLLKIDPAIDPIIQDFYLNKVGPYWNHERKHIDSAYQSIQFDFEEIELKQKFSIKEQRNPEQLKGYFNSWSSVQNYLRKNPGGNPVGELMKRLKKHWKSGSPMQVIFPVFLRVWRVNK